MHPLIVACLSSPNYPPQGSLHSHLPKCMHIAQAPTNPIPLPKESQIYLISPQRVLIILIDPDPLANLYIALLSCSYLYSYPSYPTATATATQAHPHQYKHTDLGAYGPGQTRQRSAGAQTGTDLGIRQGYIDSSVEASATHRTAWVRFAALHRLGSVV